MYSTTKGGKHTVLFSQLLTVMSTPFENVWWNACAQTFKSHSSYAFKVTSVSAEMYNLRHNTWFDVKYIQLWKSFHAALCSPVKEVSAPLTASTGVKRTRSSLVFVANVLIIWWLESRITLIKAEVLAICWSGAFRYVLAVCFGRCHICFDTHTSDRAKLIKRSKSHDSDSTETC